MINCKVCGVETERGRHTGRFCKPCYNKGQKDRYQNAHYDYQFLTSGNFTSQQLARMPWRRECK